MTDRDTFAAAALTGLVNTHAVYHKEPPGLATMAYAMADAMLRERAKTNHDAAPSATAGTPGTGDTQEPVAWGVADGKGLLATSISRMDAVDMQSDYAYHTEIVPLYRSPTLTDAEREAVAWAEDCADSQREWKIAATLRGLLERMGGGR